MEDMDKDDYRKPSGDEGEVMFSQQEEGAASAGSHGPGVDRRNEKGWLEDTEPYHGARPRMIDVNQLVDNVLGATMGTAGQDMDFRDTPARCCLRSNKSNRRPKFRRHHDGNHAEMEVNHRKDPG